MSKAGDQAGFRYEVVADDREQVRRIVAATGYFSDAEIEIAVELVEDRLAKGERSDYHFVFLDRGEDLAGYGCFGEIPCTVGSYDVYWIAVDPNCQGQGIGKQLMREIERRIVERGGRHVYAETSGRPQYAPTRQFYERCGYEVASVLPDFYAPGDARVTYRKLP